MSYEAQRGRKVLGAQRRAPRLAFPRRKHYSTFKPRGRDGTASGGHQAGYLRLGVNSFVEFIIPDRSDRDIETIGLAQNSCPL